MSFNYAVVLGIVSRYVVFYLHVALFCCTCIGSVQKCRQMQTQNRRHLETDTGTQSWSSGLGRCLLVNSLLDYR